jgi:Holliday junction resolvase RusA-like endonuclease
MLGRDRIVPILEFTVEGAPVSHQTKNKVILRAWKNRVRAEASRVWSGPALTGNLRFVLTYYYEGDASSIDDDNMVKPIRDALIGLAYADDRQITDSAIRQTTIDGAFRVRGHSLVLLRAFSVGKEFLHIKVEPAPDHQTLLT